MPLSTYHPGVPLYLPLTKQLFQYPPSILILPHQCNPSSPTHLFSVSPTQYFSTSLHPPVCPSIPHLQPQCVPFYLHLPPQCAPSISNLQPKCAPRSPTYHPSVPFYFHLPPQCTILSPTYHPSVPLNLFPIYNSSVPLPSSTYCQSVPLHLPLITQCANSFPNYYPSVPFYLHLTTPLCHSISHLPP